MINIHVEDNNEIYMNNNTVCTRTIYVQVTSQFQSIKSSKYIRMTTKRQKYYNVLAYTSYTFFLLF